MWAVAPADEDHVLEAGLLLDRIDQPGEVPIDETDGAAGVLQDVGEFLRREPQVQRVHHTPAEQRGVEQREVLG